MGWTLTLSGEADRVSMDGSAAGTFTAGSASSKSDRLTLKTMTAHTFSGDGQRHTNLTVTKSGGLTATNPWILLSGNDMQISGSIVDADLAQAVDFIRLTGNRNQLTDWWVSTDRHALVLSGADYNQITGWQIECGSQADDTWDGINITTSDYNQILGVNVMGDGGANNPQYGVNITDAASNDNYLCGIHSPDAQSGHINDAGTGTRTCVTNEDIEAAVAYGEISAIGNTTATTISVAGTPVQVTIFDTDGESNNTTPANGTDDITIDTAGTYLINVSATVNSVAGLGSRFEMTVQKNNGASAVGALHCDRNIAGGGGQSGVISMSGLAALSLNDTVEVWIENETNTANYVVENITLSVLRVGD